MNTVLILVAAGVIGFAFPVVAAVIVYRRGYPGWCVATILSIPLAIGWLVAIFALMKPDQRQAGAKGSPPAREAVAAGNRPFAEHKPLVASPPKVQSVSNAPAGTSSRTGTRIFIGIISLVILGLVVMVATIAIRNMEEDIATQNIALLIVRAVLEIVFMTLFLSVFLLQFPAFERGQMKMAATFSAGLAVVFMLVSFLILNRSVQRLPVFDENYWNVMEAACNGRGNSEAAVYQPGGGIHKVVSVTRRLYPLPFEWLPTSLADTELVLCVGDQVVTALQTCQYTGNHTFTRYQITRKVSLVALSSGDVVAERTLQGGDPGNCPYQISGSGSDTGPDVEDETIVDWMRPHIEN